MTSTPPVEPLISVPEAARRLDIPLRTCYRWVYNGHLISVQDPITKRIGVAPASVRAAAARTRVVV